MSSHPTNSNNAVPQGLESQKYSTQEAFHEIPLNTLSPNLAPPYANANSNANNAQSRRLYRFKKYEGPELFQLILLVTLVLCVVILAIIMVVAAIQYNANAPKLIREDDPLS